MGSRQGSRITPTPDGWLSTKGGGSVADNRADASISRARMHDLELLEAWARGYSSGVGDG